MPGLLSKPIYFSWIDSPFGPLMLVSDGRALNGLYFIQQRYSPKVTADWTLDDAAEPFSLVRRQLAAYFAGQLREFSIPLSHKGTAFQEAVWEALRSIPYGGTATYSEIAHQIGHPKSMRAVGQANAHNPISIIVPCHRVIGSKGQLTGYGGGLERKAALLTLEGVRLLA